MTTPLPVADQLAIREVIARYAWALDTGDVEGFVAGLAEVGYRGWISVEMLERPGEDPWPQLEAGITRVRTAVALCEPTGLRPA